MLPQTATPLGKERVCTFGGDPHLTSFLGTRFDLHLEGVYTLLEYGQDVKIQMGIRNCGPNPSWLSGGLKVSCAQELAVQLQANTRVLVANYKAKGWSWCTRGDCASRPYPTPLYKMCDKSNRGCVEGKRTLSGTDVTIDTLQFKVYFDVSKWGFSGGLKLKRESSWFLSAAGVCGGGPTSTSQLAAIGSRLQGGQTKDYFPCRRCIIAGGYRGGFCQCNEFLVPQDAQLTSATIANDARNTDSFVLPQTTYFSAASPAAAATSTLSAFPAVRDTIALWSPKFKRFARMSSSTVDRSDERADGTLPLQWEWEKWQVVDARNGLVALWSPTWKRFLRMNDKTGNAALDFSDARADGVLPEGWEWERFQLVPGPSGTVALWSPTWRRFARMDESRLSRSDVAADATLPAAWAWEAFKVTTLSSPVADEAQAHTKACTDALRADAAGALALGVSALKEETDALIAGCVADRLAGMDDAVTIELDQLCVVAYLEGQRRNPCPNLCKLQEKCKPEFQSSICGLRPNLDRPIVQPCAPLKDKQQCCSSSESANSQNVCISGRFPGGAACASVEWLTAQGLGVQEAAETCEGVALASTRSY